MEDCKLDKGEALLIPHINNLNISCPDDEKTLDKTPKNLGPGRDGINLAAMSRKKIERFGKILQIVGLTEAYIKEWRSLRKGKTAQPIEIMLDNK